MNCEKWNESLIGRVYDEITPEDALALEDHLGGCGACRATLEEFRRVRNVLVTDEPDLPRLPRVVVLRGRGPMRPFALAASILAAALLAGLGAGAGYALGARQAPASGAVASNPSAPVAASEPSAATRDATTDAMVRQEVDRRMTAWTAAHPPTGVSAEDLRAELTRFERKIDGTRAADLDYMIGQIQASEVRTGTRIGKTNEVLRDVALASNPYVSAQ